MITNSNKTYIHYGSEHFEPERFKVVTNRDFWNKPEGGLWASAVDADYGWKDWCEDEEFHVDRLETSFKFRFKPEAKVLVLRMPTDAKDMPRLKNVSEIALSCTNSDIYLDFVRLRDELGIDAVEIEDINAMYWSMYGWDCDSIVVLNPNAIEEVNENER